MRAVCTLPNSGCETLALLDKAIERELLAVLSDGLTLLGKIRR